MSKKSTHQESKHEDRTQKTNQEEEIKRNFESHFLRLLFFLNRNKERLRQKNQDIFQKRMWKQKNSKMFLKIMHDKTILKAKIDDTQEKQGFKKW